MRNFTGILAILTLILAGLACSDSDETLKANALVAEANKFITTANESVVKAESKFGEYEKMVNSIKNNTGLEETQTFAKEFMPLYDTMKENFAKAGEKFDEASKLKVKEKHKEYLETKAKEMKLRGEYAGELKKIPQAFLDSNSEKEYRQNVSDLAEKINKMTSEARELGEKAAKIQKENPDVMEQSK